MAIQPRRPENDPHTDPTEPPKRPPGGIGVGGWILLAGLPALIIVAAIVLWGGYLGWDAGTVDEPAIIETPQN